ncbi:GNAT family N-acetyltransferase [Aciduricibacillus chroicocephali]|uniref:GNAT family N-acetyltransferase n=1 Tax=Aciduricibacillus chroicocephali TaxID=3054939 RepID=A0ABY9KWA5_9BACI|nr:GNAT family N-acetyltransferase [Bacillaceae bacterium 44XB]
MNKEYMFKNKPPEPEAYMALRLECGLSGKSRESAEAGLPNSLFAVSVYDGSVLVGMGRVIGDGGTFLQVVDIAVKPACQGQGLGKKIVRQIMNYLDKNAYEGTYVSLLADIPADELYKQFGFNYTYPRSCGMVRRY